MKWQEGQRRVGPMFPELWLWGSSVSAVQQRYDFRGRHTENNVNHKYIHNVRVNV